MYIETEASLQRAVFCARGAVARRKGVTNLKVITPQNVYCPSILTGSKVKSILTDFPKAKIVALS